MKPETPNQNSPIRNPNSEIIRVLLVEDNPGDARLIQEALDDAGATSSNTPVFDLERADKLSTGLEHLDKGGIDVALLDLSLPDSHGFDTFIKARSQAPDVPIIVLTGTDDEALATQAVRQGAQDYMVKEQVEGDLLGRSIRYAVERHRMLAQLEENRQELKASEVRLRKIIEKNSDGIIIVDGGGIVHFVNPAAEILFGRKSEELLGEFFEFPVVEDETSELEIIRKNEERVVAEMRVVEIEWEGEIAYLASLRDITEFADLREELKTLSTVDELTGLYNRRGFLTLAEQQLNLINRNKRETFLLFADLDNMKWINDTLGHDEGDRALIETANILKEAFRDSDIIARLGGDEFVVLAVETSEGSGEIITTRFQKIVETHNAREDAQYSLSISLGIAPYDSQHPSSIDGLLAQADALMYEQKQRKKKSIPR